MYQQKTLLVCKTHIKIHSFLCKNPLGFSSKFNSEKPLKLNSRWEWCKYSRQVCLTAQSDKNEKNSVKLSFHTNTILITSPLAQCICMGKLIRKISLIQKRENWLFLTNFSENGIGLMAKSNYFLYGNRNKRTF